LNVFYKKPKDDKWLEIVNDINSDLINLHICIKEYPYTLSLYLRQMFISRELFVKIRRWELTSSNHIQKAAYFFYLITQSFGSKWTVFGMSAKSGRKPKDIYRDFNVWSKRLKWVTIENLSYKELIKRYDSEDTLFYLDPPYYSQESYYGKWDFDREDHLKLREILKNIKWKFLLSYNNHEEIKKLYSDDKFKIIESKPIEYILWKSVSKKKKIVSELFIMNY
jgi:DNA adenine methylase